MIFSLSRNLFIFHVFTYKPIQDMLDLYVFYILLRIPNGETEVGRMLDLYVFNYR
jgi:hypothetical protein